MSPPYSNNRELLHPSHRNIEAAAQAQEQSDDIIDLDIPVSCCRVLVAPTTSPSYVFSILLVFIAEILSPVLTVLCRPPLGAIRRPHPISATLIHPGEFAALSSIFLCNWFIESCPLLPD
jgi:hypothetical protein